MRQRSSWRRRRSAASPRGVLWGCAGGAENNARRHVVLDSHNRPGGSMVRSMYLFVAAVALATAPFVQAAEPVVAEPAVEETVQVEAALPSPILTLKALFAPPATEEVIETIDGVAVGMGAMEVVVARIDTDGHLVTACVDSEAAARAFLDSPVEKVATKKAKEQ